MRVFLALFISIIMFISGCGGGDSSNNKEGNYEATKKMVVDILQTEDGKKVFRELLTDEEMKKNLVIESDVVKESISDMLTSEKGREMWANLFKDPTFVEGFALSMADEQKKLMKALMSDAEFQKQMLDLLQNPEIDDQILTLMKSQQFRSHLEETIQHTLGTPLFQSKMTEILLKVAETKQQKESSEEESKDDKQKEAGNSGEGQNRRNNNHGD